MYTHTRMHTRTCEHARADSFVIKCLFGSGLRNDLRIMTYMYRSSVGRAGGRSVARIAENTPRTPRRTVEEDRRQTDGRPGCGSALGAQYRYRRKKITNGSSSRTCNVVQDATGICTSPQINMPDLKYTSSPARTPPGRYEMTQPLFWVFSDLSRWASLAANTAASLCPS